MQRFIAEHVDSIICYLTGISEVYQIIELTQEGDLGWSRVKGHRVRHMMVSTLGAMCSLSKHICTMVEETQLINTYRHICTTKSLILKNVRLEGFRRNFCVSGKYQCAFKSCQKEAGVWLPWHPGRGVQHLPLESYDGSVECVGDSASGSPQQLVADFAASQQRTLEKHVVVACSFKCYCRVKAYLYDLGGNMWRHIYVVRGTKRVPEQLERALEAVMNQRDLDDRRSGNEMCWSAVPGEYDGLIDALDREQHILCT